MQKLCLKNVKSNDAVAQIMQLIMVFLMHVHFLVHKFSANPLCST